MKKKLLFTLAVLLYFVGLAIAQPYTLDKKIKPIQLRLIPYSGDKGDSTWKGQVNFTTVTPKKDTTYFFLNGLSVYQPVFLSATGKKNIVEIILCKNTWKSADQKGNLKTTGKWETHFKTEGSFGIMVITKTREPYQLFTWVGKPLRGKDIGAPFKKQEAKAGSNSKTKAKKS